MANHIIRNARVNISHETCEDGVADAQPAHARPLPQLRLLGVPNNPYDVTGMLSDDRDDVRSTTSTRSWNNYLFSRYRTQGSSLVSFESRQTCEVRVWKPKCEAHQTCVSEAPLPKRDVQ